MGGETGRDGGYLEERFAEKELSDVQLGAQERVLGYRVSIVDIITDDMLINSMVIESK